MMLIFAGVFAAFIVFGVLCSMIVGKRSDDIE